ncbi:MAG: histidine phosphatase family protein [archaeon]
MLTLYLVRHGETDWNTEQRMQGTVDTELNSTGVSQAERLAMRLGNKQISAVYSSALRRAIVTAEIIAGPHNLKVNHLAEFNEINYGAFEGLTRTEIRQRFAREWEERERDKANVPPPQGESYLKLYGRVQRGLDRVFSDHKKGSIVIVGHGGSLRMIIANLMKTPVNSKLSSHKFKNGSLTVIEIDGTTAKQNIFNCDEHLREDEG